MSTMEILNENDDVVINFDKLTPKTDFLLSEFDRIPGSDFLFKILIFRSLFKRSSHKSFKCSFKPNIVSRPTIARVRSHPKTIMIWGMIVFFNGPRVIHFNHFTDIEV